MAEMVTQLQTTKRVYQHDLFHVPTTHDTILLGSKPSLLQAMPFNICVLLSPGYIKLPPSQLWLFHPYICLASARMQQQLSQLDMSEALRSLLDSWLVLCQYNRPVRKTTRAATHVEGFSLRKLRNGHNYQTMLTWP